MTGVSQCLTIEELKEVRCKVIMVVSIAVWLELILEYKTNENPAFLQGR